MARGGFVFTSMRRTSSGFVFASARGFGERSISNNREHQPSMGPCPAPVVAPVPGGTDILFHDVKQPDAFGISNTHSICSQMICRDT
jgi:hypothetical protein